MRHSVSRALLLSRRRHTVGQRRVDDAGDAGVVGGIDRLRVGLGEHQASCGQCPHGPHRSNFYFTAVAAPQGMEPCGRVGVGAAVGVRAEEVPLTLNQCRG